MTLVPKGFESHVADAVAHYWKTLRKQSRRQLAGDADRGARAAVTGGKQMDGFCHLIRWLLRENDMPEASLLTDSRLVLPGHYRTSTSSPSSRGRHTRNGTSCSFGSSCSRSSSMPQRSYYLQTGLARRADTPSRQRTSPP